MAHMVKTYIESVLARPSPGVHVFRLEKQQLLLAMTKVVYSYWYFLFDTVDFSISKSGVDENDDEDSKKLKHDFSHVKSLGNNYF